MGAAAIPLVVPAAEALWGAIVAVGSAAAAALGLVAISKTVDKAFPAQQTSATVPCPEEKKPVLMQYHPPPRDLPAFPDAERAKPKTPFRGGGKRKRWRTAGGDILEWDYENGRVEKYDKRGNHKGEYDPDTGEKTKDAVPTRKVEP
jgi:hypothetical protein